MSKYTEKDYINKCKELNDIFIGTHKEFHKGTMIDYMCNNHLEKASNLVIGHTLKPTKGVAHIALEDIKQTKTSCLL